MVLYGLSGAMEETESELRSCCWNGLGEDEGESVGNP